MKPRSIHYCGRCGKQIPLAQKCYVKTFINKGVEPIVKTTYTGKTLTITKQPSPRTRMTIGLCADCTSEAEALLTAWRRAYGRPAEGREPRGDQVHGE